MSYKTVNFNIFEENLQDIVYGERNAARNEDNNEAKTLREKTTQKLREILIKPITERSAEGESRR